MSEKLPEHAETVRALKAESPAMSFGWVPPDQRTPEQKAADFAARSTMPRRFQLLGNDLEDRTDAKLWQFVRIANGGAHLPAWFQESGCCLAAGTPVRMADGSEKPIEQVSEGDAVVTHTGSARRVIGVSVRLYTGAMYTVNVVGFPFPVTMTADHKMAVWRDGRLSWVRADGLDPGDELLVADRQPEYAGSFIDVARLFGPAAVVGDDRVRLKNSKYANAIHRRIAVTPSLARLVGLYLAEGGVHEGRVTFTFHRRERALAAEVISLIRGIFGVSAKTVLSKTRPTLRFVRCQNVNVAAVFKAMVPGNVYDKRTPGAFLTAGPEVRLALLLGWMAGDGYAAVGRRKTRHKGATYEQWQTRVQGVTVSAGLARDMTMLALSCGLKAHTGRRAARAQRETAYDVTLAGPKVVSLFPALAAKCRAVGMQHRHRLTDARRTPFGYARPVREISTEQVADRPVYDIEVEEDHSFVANGLVSSNCVGINWGKIMLYVMAVEAIRLRELERFTVPFWPYTYGKGRERGGMSRPGEGSFGSIQAEAATKDGTVEQDGTLPGPKERSDGSLTWGKSVEVKWSDGDAAPADVVERAKKHLCRTAAPCANPDDCRDALRNGYPLTIASNWGGLMQCPTQGNPPVLLNKRSGSWSHQMGVIGWWDHPELGEIFCVSQSWGTDAHGTPPDDAPPGTFWVKRNEIDWICRNGEVFAFSQFEGFPVNVLSWVI